MTDIRAVWVDDRDGVQHAVTLENARHTGATSVHADSVTTDCGINVPNGSTLHASKPITCDECLWGVLDDGALRIEEPVVMGAA